MGKRWLSQEILALVAVLAVVLVAIYISIFAPLKRAYHQRCLLELSIGAKKAAMHSRFREAAQEYEAAIEEARQLGSPIVRLAVELAAIYIRQGKLKLAERLLAESTEIQKKTPDYTKTRDWQFTVLQSGDLNFKRGKKDLAMKQWQEVVDLGKTAAPRDSSSINLAVYCAREAEQRLDNPEKTLNKSSADNTSSAQETDVVAEENQEKTNAEAKRELAREEISKSNKKKKEDSTEDNAGDVSAVLSTRREHFFAAKNDGGRAFKEGRFDVAIKDFQVAIKLAENGAVDHEKHWSATEGLAKTYRRMGRLKESREQIARMAQINQKWLEEATAMIEHEKKWQAMIDKAHQEAEAGKLDDAKRTLQDALELAVGMGKKELVVGKSHLELARLYARMQKPGNARQEYEMALLGVPEGLDPLRKDLVHEYEELLNSYHMKTEN